MRGPVCVRRDGQGGLLPEAAPRTASCAWYRPDAAGSAQELLRRFATNHRGQPLCNKEFSLGCAQTFHRHATPLYLEPHEDGMDAFLDAGSALGAALAEPRERFDRRIARAKRKEYPRRDAAAWTRADYAHSGLIQRLRHSVPDMLERCEASAMTESDFADKYERGSQPVVVTGLTSKWPAVQDGRWRLETLLREHGQDRFKVGEDDDGYAVYVKLKHFVRYAIETVSSRCIDWAAPHHHHVLTRRPSFRSHAHRLTTHHFMYSTRLLRNARPHGQ